MKTIIVTAGGTIEPIDGVRGITNFSRGRLGHMIAERLAINHRVIYIRSRTAPAPNENIWPRMGDTLIDVPVSDTASVWKAIQDVKESGTDVDLFIHAMAISDYTVDKIVDLEMLISRLVFLASSGDQNVGAIADALYNPPTVEAGGKVSSTMQHPLLYLKPTEKILPKIKTLWPNTTLVGFKLLNGVPLSELLSVAETAMQKVDGDYVLANDLTQINGEDHVAHLLARGEPAAWRRTAYTKTEIVDLFEDLANR